MVAVQKHIQLNIDYIQYSVTYLSISHLFEYLRKQTFIITFVILAKKV